MLVLGNLLILSFAVAGLSVTTAKAKVTQPMRDWIAVRNGTFGHLVGCPYCLSHWFAFILVGWLPMTGIEVTKSLALNWFIATFAVVALSALITGAILRILWMQENEIEELKEDIQGFQEDIEELMEERDTYKSALRVIAEGEKANESETTESGQ